MNDISNTLAKGEIRLIEETQGTFYEIKNSPVPGFWPDIKPSDIITKRAQLALLLHNNNLSALTPDTAAELMYQVPAPILTHARPESPISIKPRTTSISKPTPRGKENEYSVKSMDVEFYSDSHGRGLPELIGACSKGKIKVSGLVMPGATTEQVYKQAEGALCRPTVIIAGTNNITKKSTGEIYTCGK
ncbi:hypothetical protein J6590_072679 [Homalodisca vitripennis]|nr:hypothetical protein J6590_072679 [Homalodisca vitripennis]